MTPVREVQIWSYRFVKRGETESWLNAGNTELLGRLMWEKTRCVEQRWDSILGVVSRGQTHMMNFNIYSWALIMNHLPCWLCISWELKSTVWWVHGAEKRAYTAHGKVWEWHVVFVCRGVGEGGGGGVRMYSHLLWQIINQCVCVCVCVCVGGMWGLFSLYTVSLVVLAQIPPHLMLNTLLFDYAQILFFYFPRQ